MQALESYFFNHFFSTRNIFIAVRVHLFRGQEPLGTKKPSSLPLLILPVVPMTVEVSSYSKLPRFLMLLAF